MKLTIHGAAGEVTGSMYEIYCEQRDMRLLIDVGSLQSDRGSSPRPFPFDPESVDSLLLTHAHIDHIGELPRLVREGFAGRIYATRETMLLGRASLMNAASLGGERPTVPTTWKPHSRMQSVPPGQRCPVLHSGT